MTPRQPGTSRPLDVSAVPAPFDPDATATAAAPEPASEPAQAVLDRRAAALARVPPRPPDAAQLLRVAVLSLAAERYAIETRFVRRVVRLEELTPIPGAPEALAGVINLRGEILDVFDLRLLFNLPVAEPTERSRVVVLGDERDEFGVLADAAHEVTALRLDDLHEPPGPAPGGGRHLLRGVTASTLIVLDGDALLRDGRLFIDQTDDAGA
ncbi:MAG TPA: chemotaxis protein CheW [Isosphaeraceae bacterium]